jgi:hypothetical protein
MSGFVGSDMVARYSEEWISTVYPGIQYDNETLVMLYNCRSDMEQVNMRLEFLTGGVGILF